MKRCLVTGSSVLISSEVMLHFHRAGFAIHGIDHNQHAAFFGHRGDTRWNQRRMAELILGFTFHDTDIRDRAAGLKKRMHPCR